MIQDDTIQYPLDTLQCTAGTQRNALNDAWQNHQAHIQQHILTPALSLIHGGDTLHQHISSWNQTLEDHYNALHTFLNVLDGSATTMGTADTNVSKGFEQKEQ